LACDGVDVDAVGGGEDAETADGGEVCGWVLVGVCGRDMGWDGGGMG
jgi:hypothetical protein